MASDDSKLLRMAKTAIRISGDVFDDNEIIPLILAGKQDLERSGVDVALHPQSDLVDRAITLYVKLNFGNCPQFEQLSVSYEKMKAFLATGEYHDG